MTVTALVARLAEAAHVPWWSHLSPAERTSGALVRTLWDHGRRFTVLADALDEAQDPYGIARHVLIEIAALPRCRVVLGTRASLHDDPDGPVDTGDLLAILSQDHVPEMLVVDSDKAAISTYVQLRLRAARNADALDVSDLDIRQVADLIREKDRQFLFARLAVHELLARPRLLDPQHRAELNMLLRGDHRQLFATAVERLSGLSSAAVPLLAALAFGQGRGVPRSGRVWATMASALRPAGEAIDENDIDQLVTRAAPYIMLDAEYGQSVYRLAHRTFQEHFLAIADAEDAHRRLAHGLIAYAGRDERRSLSNYVIKHLPAHVARGDVWPDLVRKPDLLDLVDADAIAAEVLGSTAEPATLPPEINAVSRSLHVLGRAAEEARRLIRGGGRREWRDHAVGTQQRPPPRSLAHRPQRPDTCHGQHDIDQRPETARLHRRRRHAATVEKARNGPPSGSEREHRSYHHGYPDLSARRRPERRPADAGGHQARVRGRSNRPAGGRYRLHRGPEQRLLGMIMVRHRPLVATQTGGTTRAIDMVDAASREWFANIEADPYGDIDAAVGLLLPGAHMLFLATWPSGSIMLWNPTTDDNPRYLRGHISKITALVLATGSTGQPMLVTGSDDRTIRHRDIETGRPIGSARGTVDAVRGLARLPARDDKGDRIVSVAGHGLHIWQVDDPSPPARLIKLGARSDYTGVATIRTTTGADVVVVSTTTRRLIAWDPVAERVLRNIELDAELRTVSGVGPDLLIDSDAGPFVLRVRREGWMGWAADLIVGCRWPFGG